MNNKPKGTNLFTLIGVIVMLLSAIGLSIGIPVFPLFLYGFGMATAALCINIANS